MPSHMAGHWNFQGKVDGYVSKAVGMFLIPIISLFFYVLFLLIPKIDPLKENIAEFQHYLDGFMLQFTTFLLYIYGLTIFWNLGFRFNMGQFLAPAFGSLMFYTGILIQNAKMNWSVGIRTPWTMSSKDVWERTHKIGGKMFKINGIVCLLGIFYPEAALMFILAPIMLAVLFIVLYSYIIYNQEQKTKLNTNRVAPVTNAPTIIPKTVSEKQEEKRTKFTKQKSLKKKNKKN